MAHDAQSKKVLVVDDEPAASQLLRMLLTTHGYTISSARTPQEALLKVNGGVDLILLNVLFPNHDGFQICRFFKTSPSTKNIPIIILSAQNNGDKVESFHLGADDYLTKPFQPEELFARMEVVLRRHHPSFLKEYDQEQYDIIHELHQIVEEGRITPFFQPIYFLKPMHLFGMEVLSRPQTTGILENPEILFRSALRYGLYCRMEMVVWQKALKIASEKFEGQHLFLNCNPYLIESDSFSQVTKIVEDAGMSSDKIFLEITERSAIGEYQAFFDKLSEYRRHGFKIAIDDLGAGYSSLETIVQTHPEVVKIDRHIIKGLLEDPFKRSIVKLIVAFCRENSIICIAEGIETKQDLEILLELGVPAGQGYFLYRPTEFIDLNAMRAIAA